MHGSDPLCQRSSLPDSELALTLGNVLLMLVAGTVTGAIYFGLYVWAARRIATAVGIRGLVVDAGNAIATGIMVSAIITVATLCLVLPGLIAATLLSLSATIVAFEGRGRWDAARESARTVRAYPSAFIGLLGLMVGASIMLNPATWGVALGPGSYLWQFAVSAAISAYGAVAYTVAYRQTRTVSATLNPTATGSTSPAGASTTYPGIAAAPGTAVRGAVIHAWVAPDGVHSG